MKKMRFTIRESALYTNYHLVPDQNHQTKRFEVREHNKIIETFSNREAAEEFAAVLNRKGRIGG